MWDNLALHTGRMDTLGKMVVQVQAIARTRLGGSLLVPMDFSALRSKGKFKDAKEEQGQRGQGERTGQGRRGRNGRSSKREPQEELFLMRQG